MRDELDYEADAPTRECPVCGDEMGSEAVWYCGQYVHERCLNERRDVQQSIDADRRADVDEEDACNGHDY